MHKFLVQKIIIILCMLHLSISLNAKVTQVKADSITKILNSANAVCDQSCSLYAQEHPGASLTNTIFISILLALGAAWLYVTYKKKYIIAISSILIILVLGSYFAQPLFRSKTVPKNCPVLKKKSPISSASLFASPGNEFTQDTTNSEESARTLPPGDEFSQASTEEFSSANANTSTSNNNEFQSADSISTLTSPTKVDNKVNESLIYEPIVIFFILGIIGFMIRYSWFRKTRGLFLLGGLLYLGFYRGGCSCMISSFQSLILFIMGLKINWEALLWFLLLIPATYLFGRVWCGWLCHLGALQEFLFRSRKLRLINSLKAQKYLKIIQISAFGLWIVQLVITQTNLFCEIDPFKVAFNMIAVNWIGYALLGILLISSVLIYKPFCRTLCPVGLILGWVSFIPGARRLNKNDFCVNCKNCNDECNQRAMIHEERKTVLHNEDCIMCGECFDGCKKKALKIKNHKPGTKILSVMILALMISSTVKAQWECPSRLGGSLKPFGQSNLMWAGEVTTTGGFIEKSALSNLLVFGALDYSVNKNTFYLEGGFKSWYRSGGDRDNNGLYSFGLREAFYRYSGEKQTLTLGLHSAKSDDYYLLNERVVGANYRVKLGNIDFNAVGGSIMKDFARNGTFCTLGYLYNIVPGRPRSDLGNSFGQTNLGMVTLTWHPNSSKGDNEFSSGGEFGTTPKESFLNIKSLGLVAYHEFGDLISQKAFITGAYGEFSLGGINLKPEILLQSSKNNNAIIYSAIADKQIDWANGQMTKLFARYIGMKKNDAGAIATNSFSNIFAGEVLRLDALDMPFVQIGLKHSFPAIKTSLKIQGAMQTGAVTGYTPDDYNTTPGKMKELDLTLSKNLGKAFLLNATIGYLNHPNMITDDSAYLKYVSRNSFFGKVELRITF